MKEYVQSDEYRARRSERRKALWRTNPNFRLSDLLHNRLAYSLRNKSKLGSAVTLLGCSLHDAIAHIESQFEQGMSWENWGEWYVDYTGANGMLIIFVLWHHLILKTPLLWRWGVITPIFNRFGLKKI